MVESEIIKEEEVAIPQQQPVPNEDKVPKETLEGWFAITKEGELLSEKHHGRPMEKGEQGKLAVIGQSDFGHTVAIDLNQGIIFFEPTKVGVQNGTVEMHDPKYWFFICEDTTIVGEMADHERIEVPLLDEAGEQVQERNWEQAMENGEPVFTPEGQPVMKHTDDGSTHGVTYYADKLTPLIFRPIWFTRWTNGIPTKIIGAQTTTPESMGGRNVKKMIMLFSDGRIGIY